MPNCYIRILLEVKNEKRREMWERIAQLIVLKKNNLTSSSVVFRIKTPTPNDTITPAAAIMGNEDGMQRN